VRFPGIWGFHLFFPAADVPVQPRRVHGRIPELEGGLDPGDAAQTAGSRRRSQLQTRCLSYRKLQVFVLQVFVFTNICNLHSLHFFTFNQYSLMEQVFCSHFKSIF
jgi:hypothetical protein